MWLFTPLTLLASLTVVLASHIVHEKRDFTHPSWAKRSRLPTENILPMRIGLAQQNLHQAHDLLMSISDPSSPNYGQHWTAKQVTDVFAPAKETVNAVKEWLVSAGIADERLGKTADGAWVGFEATVGEAERLLKTEFWAWEFMGSDSAKTVACDE